MNGTGSTVRLQRQFSLTITKVRSRNAVTQFGIEVLLGDELSNLLFFNDYTVESGGSLTASLKKCTPVIARNDAAENDFRCSRTDRGKLMTGQKRHYNAYWLIIYKTGREVKTKIVYFMKNSMPTFR